MSVVFAGLSGGVDSSVSAALLQSQGHRVIGVFIKIWQPEFIECTWREDRLDAMRVCAALGIPYKEIDLSDEYKRLVVDEMVASYRTGKTPNPDVLCNRAIKFGSFFDWAKMNRADMVATGHYARAESGKLLRGHDESKDQSYFLHRLSHEELGSIIFPIGHMQKSDVRAIAAKMQLPVAQKADSQGLCFVGDVSLPEFLSRYIELREGLLLDMKGERVGTHPGAALFTIGQRHGFIVANHSPTDPPLYVTKIDTARNEVTVSATKEAATAKGAHINDMHWISGMPYEGVCAAQARYREKAVAVRVASRGDRTTVTFDEPHMLSPGQSLVLYDGEECLGGGAIDAIE
ncbi:MAG: tRNA 2-thiouridine(34) synthase MnmA [Candidatus Kaiserbacteria bacterium]|nr:tRNA 2-thiouridine(34) synthase MnmA [Candidatus Kaiserbacteria bacterium]